MKSHAPYQSATPQSTGKGHDQGATGTGVAMPTLAAGRGLSQGDAFEMNGVAGNGFVQGLAFGGGGDAGGGAGTGDGKGSAIGGFAMGRGTLGAFGSAQGEADAEAATAANPVHAVEESEVESEGEPNPEGGPTVGTAVGDGAAPPAAAPAGGAPGAAAPGAQAGNAPAAGAPPAAPALAITVINEVPDPATQSQWDRTVIGVGEKVNFDCVQATGGTWAATAGTGAVSPDGFYEWQAPGNPGTAKITYTVNGQTASVTMAILPPMAIAATKTSDLTYASGTQGAGMTLQFEMFPNTVSFAHVEWLEDPGPGIPDGYFNQFAGSALDHSPNPNWLPMGADNKGIGDTAAFQGWGSPWSPGTWTWIIPNRYRLEGTGAGQIFFIVVQQMTIADTAGTSSVTKLGQTSASRAP